jgi:hypothetical protein
MDALETSLTWLEAMKLFKAALYKVIMTIGKKKGYSGEIFLPGLFPNMSDHVVKQINTLLAIMSKNRYKHWINALLSAQIMILKGNEKNKRKICFKYGMLPTIDLINCIPVENKNLSIIKNNVVDIMLQCVNKLNNGEMEHGLIEASSEDNNNLNESQVSALTEENEDPPHSNSIIEKEAPPEEMDVISSCTANNINNNRRLHIYNLLQN